MEKKEEKKRDGSKGVYKNPYANKLGFFVGDFPMNQAKEWLEDCKMNFDGWRWHKIWTDHWKARAYDSMMIAEYSQQPMIEEEPEEVLPKIIGRKGKKQMKGDEKSENMEKQ